MTIVMRGAFCARAPSTRGIVRSGPWIDRRASPTTASSGTSARRSSTTSRRRPPEEPSTTSWPPSLPGLRPRHARRGPQPRLQALEGASADATGASGAEPVDHRFPSDGLTLAAHLALPPTRRRRAGRRPVPRLPAGGAARVGRTRTRSWPTASPPSGLARAGPPCGAAAARRQLLLGGWLKDIAAAVAHLRRPEMPGGLAGRLRHRRRAVHLRRGPRPRHQGRRRPRRAGGLRRLGQPAPPAARARPRHRPDQRPRLPAVVRRVVPRAARRSGPVGLRRGVAPRPLLVVHGADDESVPAFDARVVADAHGSAELRIVSGAGHQLRHDPRAVACSSAGSTASGLEAARTPPPGRQRRPTAGRRRSVLVVHASLSGQPTPCGGRPRV